MIADKTEMNFLVVFAILTPLRYLPTVKDTGIVFVISEPSLKVTVQVTVAEPPNTAVHLTRPL